MKRNILLFLAFTLLGALGCAAWVEVPLAGPAERHHPESVIEISLFYDSLAPYGDWLWVDPWGWVWTPWDVEPGWRPYTHGHWVWTAFGWAWVADEPWGWAPFHYGRWSYHSHHGWLWVPDTVWAPAWVAWRSGHGWIGWAPLPPDVRWRAGIGLDLGGLDLTLGIVHHGWCFVPDRHFHEPHVWRRLEPLPRNPHHLRETADRTRYEEVDRRVAVRSIDVEEVERIAGAVRRQAIENLEKPPRTAVPKPPREDGAPPQPPPSLDKEPPERRAAREERELRAWEREQRERLDRAQVQERRQPPANGNVTERERQQQEERRALQKEVEREKQLVESRRDRRAAQAKEKEKAKDMGKAKVQEKPRKPAKPPGR